MSANRQVHSTTHVFQVWGWIYHDWILSRFLCGHLYTFERNWTGNIFLFRVLWTSNILFLSWFYFDYTEYHYSVLIRWVVSLRVACVMQYLVRPEVERSVILHYTSNEK